MGALSICLLTGLRLELMELENIVANTVYLKAREGGPEGSKGRSKKWKKLLTFPHISECIHLATTLKSDNYDYIVDQQPIGQALFRQFCVVSKKPYHHYNDFLDDVESYETEQEVISFQEKFDNLDIVSSLLLSCHQFMKLLYQYLCCVRKFVNN